jgi:tetratricopeptide (TPR) repeat protein
MDRRQTLKAYQSAERHMQAGRYAKAQISCRQALEADPNHADAAHLMGALCVRESRPDLAIEWISRAIRQDPKPLYISNLGSILQSQHRFDDALNAFDKAIQLNPSDAQTWKKLGGVLIELKRHAEAALCYQRVLTFDPQDWDAAYRAGLQHHSAEEFEEALVFLNLANELGPNQTVVLKARAGTLQRLKRFDAALDDNQRANILDPANADTCNNIGACLQALGRDEEALKWFDRTDEILPNTAQILNNRALLLGQLQRFDEAFSLYDHMTAAGLNNAVTDWNRSHIELLTGNFESGWISREARWTKADPIPYPAFDRPMWLGKEPVEGKTILVHVDEGLGDTIQFARYLPMLSARGARVILVVESPAQKAAGRALRRFPVSSFPGRRSSGVRHALPNRQPSPGVRNAP